MKQQALDDEGLQTALCEVEAILNDRPITTMSDDHNDLEALTPNHLLQLKRKPIMPPGLFCKQDLYSRKRWRQEMDQRISPLVAGAPEMEYLKAESCYW